MSALSVRHEVSRVFIKDDVVFCHQYPTGTCVGGNSWVRSFRDNVASACTGRQPIREVTLRLPALSDPSAVQLASLCMFGAALLKEPFILPLEDEAFDIVLFNSGVEHLTDPDKAASEIRRVLKREGVAVFSGPGIYPKHEYPIDNMLRFPTEESWAAVLRDPREIVEFRKTKPQSANPAYKFDRLVFASVVKCKRKS